MDASAIASAPRSRAGRRIVKPRLRSKPYKFLRHLAKKRFFAGETFGFEKVGDLLALDTDLPSRREARELGGAWTRRYSIRHGLRLHRRVAFSAARNLAAPAESPSAAA